MPAMAMNISAMGIARKAPVGPQFSTSAMSNAIGIWNNQKPTKLIMVGVRVSPAPLNACVTTIPMP